MDEAPAFFVRSTHKYACTKHANGRILCLPAPEWIEEIDLIQNFGLRKKMNKVFKEGEHFVHESSPAEFLRTLPRISSYGTGPPISYNCPFRPSGSRHFL